MVAVADSETIRSLLDEFERAEPVAFDLGAPILPVTAAVDRLVDLGPAAVSALVDEMEQTASSHRAAYAAFVLGLIGDRRAVAPLRAVSARYQARQDKGQWEHAVVGQCAGALARLGPPGP